MVVFERESIEQILSNRKPTETTLPPPEELPAPYAKRVYDMWAALIGEKDSVTRIA
jgi:hypothetical protein